MLIFRKSFREDIWHILMSVNIAVVNYLSCMQILTVEIANIVVFSLSLDDPCGDKSECTLIIAVDWHQY